MSVSAGDISFHKRPDAKEEFERIEKENFNLKLRIEYLEQKLTAAFPTDAQALVRETVELRAELDARQRDLEQRDILLVKARHVIENQATDMELARAQAQELKRSAQYNPVTAQLELAATSHAERADAAERRAADADAKLMALTTAYGDTAAASTAATASAQAAARDSDEHVRALTASLSELRDALTKASGELEYAHDFSQRLEHEYQSKLAALLHSGLDKENAAALKATELTRALTLRTAECEQLRASVGHGEAQLKAVELRLVRRFAQRLEAVFPALPTSTSTVAVMGSTASSTSGAGSNIGTSSASGGGGLRDEKGEWRGVDEQADVDAQVEQIVSAAARCVERLDTRTRDRDRAVAQLQKEKRDADAASKVTAMQAAAAYEKQLTAAQQALDQLTAQHTATTRALQERDSALSRLAASQQQLETRMATRERHAAAQSSEWTERLAAAQNECAAAQSASALMTKTNALLAQRVDSLKLELDTAQKGEAQANEKLAAALANTQRLEAKRLASEQSTAQLTQTVEQLTRDAEGWRRDTAHAQQHYLTAVTLDAKLRVADTELATVRRALDQVQAELDGALARERAAQAGRLAAAQQVDAVQDQARQQLEQVQTQTAAWALRDQSNEREVGRLERDLRAARAHSEQLSTALADAQARLRDADQQLMQHKAKAAAHALALATTPAPAPAPAAEKNHALSSPMQSRLQTYEALAKTCEVFRGLQLPSSFDGSSGGGGGVDNDSDPDFVPLLSLAADGTVPRLQVERALQWLREKVGAFRRVRAAFEQSAGALEERWRLQHQKLTLEIDERAREIVGLRAKLDRVVDLYHRRGGGTPALTTAATNGFGSASRQFVSPSGSAVPAIVPRTSPAALYTPSAIHKPLATAVVVATDPAGKPPAADGVSVPNAARLFLRGAAPASAAGPAVPPPSSSASLAAAIAKDYLAGGVSSLSPQQKRHVHQLFVTPNTTAGSASGASGAAVYRPSFLSGGAPTAHH